MYTSLKLYYHLIYLMMKLLCEDKIRFVVGVRPIIVFIGHRIVAR